MGGKPSKGTKADMRLKRNRAGAKTKSAGAGMRKPPGFPPAKPKRGG